MEPFELINLEGREPQPNPLTDPHFCIACGDVTQPQTIDKYNNVQCGACGEPYPNTPIHLPPTNSIFKQPKPTKKDNKNGQPNPNH